MIVDVGPHLYLPPEFWCGSIILISWLHGGAVTRYGGFGSRYGD